MKIALISIATLAILATAYVTYSIHVANPRVVEEIRNNPGGERAQIVMLLTLPDGRMIPVNYLREGDRVYAGADGPWWRAFKGDGAPVSMLIQGEEIAGHAMVELADQAFVDDVFSRLRPAAPEWLPDWLNGKLVVISTASPDH